ncbi:MAG: hypothetical protein EOP37_20420 [Rubrivivax sp.]|nr:MAG: hypothetical protein EOP37_20420 [Rubrivivax sp.]
MSDQAFSLLKAALEQHGLPCSVENDWLIPHGRLPAIRAMWNPGEQVGRLDIQAFIAKDVMIEESFGAAGAGDEALGPAFGGFVMGALHVLLSALWSVGSSCLAHGEKWIAAGRPYDAHVGGTIRRSSEGLDSKNPPELEDAWRRAIESEALTADIHWFRLYVGQVNGDFTFEALKDNERWDAGLTCLRQLPWEPAQGFYSARLFIALTAPKA